MAKQSIPEAPKEQRTLERYVMIATGVFILVIGVIAWVTARTIGQSEGSFQCKHGNARDQRECTALGIEKDQEWESVAKGGKGGDSGFSFSLGK